MSELLRCPRCKQMLDESQFQKGNKGWCRDCRIEYNRNQRRQGWKINRLDSENATENDVIRELNQHGVYTITGKAALGYWVDAVSWGCIGLEIKSSGLVEDYKFLFKFTSRQQRVGLTAEFVILVPHWLNGDTYHIFPSNAPCFYHRDGRLKTGVSFDPEAKIRRGSDGNVPLTAELMEAHKDRWDLINIRQRAIVEELNAGTFKVNYERGTGR